MSRTDDVNNDPLSAKLAGFSPAPAALDRDAIFYEAGRAAARPRRVWPAVASLLAVTQAVTLVCWLGLPRSAPVTPGLAKDMPPPAPAPKVDEPVRPANPWLVERQILERGGELPPPESFANLVAAKA